MTVFFPQPNNHQSQSTEKKKKKNAIQNKHQPVVTSRVQKENKNTGKSEKQ
jgi:hypothetical protein